MRAGLYALFSAAIVLLRIEMLSLVGISGLLLWLRENDGPERSGISVAGVRQAMPLWFGGCLAILWIRWRFGYFLPDTALAKTSQSGLAPLGGIALALASSFGLGIGFMVLWLASLALVLRAVGRRESLRGGLAVWVANLPFPLVAALSCARGQAIQGVRYLLWPLIFSTVWNAMEINRRECRASRWSRALAVCVSGILVILLPLDAHYAFKSMLGRSRTFMEMRDGGLERFAGKTIVAGDVGFIGYFGHANICDMDGLVNGRAAAAMTVDARLAACARQGIDAAFVTVDQMRAVETVEDIRSWTVCRKYDFQNVRQPDRHYLLVPEAAECGSDAHPLGTAASLMSR